MLGVYDYTVLLTYFSLFKRHKELQRLDLCLLPEGNIILYVKGTSYRILLNWMVSAYEEVNEEILEHYHSILKHPFLKQEYFLSEWGFNVNIKNTDNIFVGRIDAIFYDETNNKWQYEITILGGIKMVKSRRILSTVLAIVMVLFAKSEQCKVLGRLYLPTTIQSRFIQRITTGLAT